MITMFAARVLDACSHVLAPFVLALQPTRARRTGAQRQGAGDGASLNLRQQQEKINAWTVGLAAGLIEGAPLRLAAEMARVVDDGANLLVLPIVTRGPTENLNSLLYLRGVDLAIINSDSLEEYRVEFPEIRQPRHLPAQSLPVGAAHLRAARDPEPAGPRRQEGELQHAWARPPPIPGPLIFSRLGINIEKTFIPHPLALQQMRKGEGDMAAVVFITSKPVDAFLRGQWEPGFKFLPVTYDAKFEDYYLPAALEAADYPDLIKPGERISTISVPTVLVSYNWPVGSNRYQRVARFTDYLFSRIDKLQVAGFDPNGRRSISARRCPASPASRRRRNGCDRQARKAADKTMKTAAICAGVRVRADECRRRWRRAPAMRWRSSAPARCWRQPNGWNAWRSFPHDIAPAPAGAGGAIGTGQWRRRPTTGSSARRPHPSTTRPSPSPPLRPAPGRTAPPCSSRSSAAAAAPSW